LGHSEEHTGDEPVGESFPAEAYGGVHAHEKEKGAQKKAVERLAIRDIGCYPTFLPSFRREIQKGIGGVEHEFRRRIPSVADFRSL
jgi:hypothetical protein